MNIANSFSNSGLRFVRVVLAALSIATVVALLSTVAVSFGVDSASFGYPFGFIERNPQLSIFFDAQKFCANIIYWQIIVSCGLFAHIYRASEVKMMIWVSLLFTLLAARIDFPIPMNSVPDDSYSWFRGFPFGFWTIIGDGPLASNMLRVRYIYLVVDMSIAFAVGIGLRRVVRWAL